MSESGGSFCFFLAPEGGGSFPDRLHLTAAFRFTCVFTSVGYLGP